MVVVLDGALRQVSSIDCRREATMGVVADRGMELSPPVVRICAAIWRTYLAGMHEQYASQYQRDPSMSVKQSALSSVLRVKAPSPVGHLRPVSMLNRPLSRPYLHNVTSFELLTLYATGAGTAAATPPAAPCRPQQTATGSRV